MWNIYFQQHKYHPGLKKKFLQVKTEQIRDHLYDVAA